MATTRLSEAGILDFQKTLSNWGRWGDDDELGTINLITPEKRKQAAGLVQDGVTISCPRPIVTAPAIDAPSPPLHYMLMSGERAAADPKGPMQASMDFLGVAFQGVTITHLDALSHAFSEGKMYNNRSAALVMTREGATKESIEIVGDGLVSRGVLLDVPRLRGVDWMDPGDGIHPEELDAAAQAQGLQVEEGDILLVRTGFARRRREVGPVPFEDGAPGLDAACLPWLCERGVAVLGSDAISDMGPNGYPKLGLPIHRIGIVHMGLWLIDNCDLEDLGEACATRNRWEFQLTLAPLKIRYGTGSPVNPIAMF
jgi:kynurenine formamidase